MGLLNLFQRKSAGDFERRGDLCASSGALGAAKIEYEAALDKLPREDLSARNRIEVKIRKTLTALAAAHKQTGDDLLGGGHYREALDYYRLATELAPESELKSEAKAAAANIAAALGKNPDSVAASEGSEEERQTTGAPRSDGEDEDYFVLLCSALPEEVRTHYQNYGEAFRKGYVALNRGEFRPAAEHLELAMKENGPRCGFVAMELATAYLNLERTDEAVDLLEGVVSEQPDALPAYQLLCEIFWEREEFQRAQKLLISIPHELKRSTRFALLKGETLLRSGWIAEAEIHYRETLGRFGWQDEVARALAGVLETGGKLEDARRLLAELMNRCRSCSQRIDPGVKKQFAEVSFAAGDFSTSILELFLSLAREDPLNAPRYLRRASHIYAARGNDAESLRFRKFAEKAEREVDHRDKG